MSVIKPPFRYFGSKWRLAAWIVDQLPPHVCFVEPFGGSAAVLLSKPVSEHETYNDLNGDVVRFFRVLRERPEELAHAIRYTPWSREEHRLSFEPAADDLEAARRFYIRAWQTRGGYWRTGQSAWRYQVGPGTWSSSPRRWRAHLSQFAMLAERLAAVQIECKPALEVMARYDAPTTRHSLDPPYVPETRSARWEYEHEFGAADHEDLLEAVLELEGMVVLSGYPSEQYDDALRGWRRLEATSRTQAGRERTEVLWLSPSCDAAPRQLRLEVGA